MATRAVAITRPGDFVPDAPPTRNTAPLSVDIADPGEFVPDEKPPAKVGGIESAARGALQGATLGFGDEIAGVLGAAFTDKTYAQARDESRAANEAARQSHPWLYGGGNIAGGAATMLIPGLNVARGATAAAAAAKGAAAGAAAGLGGSNADLTKGEIGQAAIDTAIGAGIGGAIGGAGHLVGKAIAGAPKRALEARLEPLRSGVQNSTKVRELGTVAQRNAVRGVLSKEPQIEKIMRHDPERALDMVDALVSKKGQRLGDVYTKIDSARGGASGDLLRESVESLRTVSAGHRASVATEGAADAVDAMIGRLITKYGGHGPGGGLTAKELHREASQLAKQGFEGGAMFSVTTQKALKREVSGALRDVLQSHAEEVATSAGVEGVSRKIIQQANAEYSAWKGVQNLLKEKVKRLNSGSQTMTQQLGGLRSLPGRAADEIARAVDSHVIAPAVRAVPGVVAAPVGAAYRAGAQGAAASAPRVPGMALDLAFGQPLASGAGAKDDEALAAGP